MTRFVRREKGSERFERLARANQIASMSPAEVDDWIETNVTNLASAKVAIKHLALVSLAAFRLARAAHRRDDQE